MKKNKKYFAILLLCAISLATLSACGNKNNKLTGHTVTTIGTKPSIVTDVSTSTSSSITTEQLPPVNTTEPTATTTKAPITLTAPITDQTSDQKTPLEVWRDYEASLDNVKLSIESSEKFGSISDGSNTVFSIDGSVICREVISASSVVTDYLVTSAKLHTYYYQEGGRWYKTANDITDDLVSGFSPELSLAETLMKSSDVFGVFDAASGRYPIQNGAKYKSNAITDGYFELGDGKYTLSCVYTDDLGVTRSTSITFENFGGVKITLPEAAEKTQTPITAPIDHPENAPTPENVLRKINNAEKLTCDIHYSYQKGDRIAFIDYNIALDGAEYKFAFSNSANGALVELFTEKYDDFTYNVYKKDDSGVWNVSSIPSRNFRSILPEDEGLLSLDLGRLLYSGNFSEYDKTRGTYALADGIVVDCSLGDIVSAYLEIVAGDSYVIGATIERADGSSAELSMMFFGIGTTSVDLPDVAMG